MAFFTKPSVDVKGKPGADIKLGAGVNRSHSGILGYLSGENAKYRPEPSPYLPQELIGGSIPHVAGMEEEAVWNAACQACGTEKVHYCYTIEGKRLWYLACPSTALASAPDSWCPLAAALPGNSEYWDRETVYIYEQEGLASALRWDPETGRMQVFMGASRTLLPRIQSMDANFVTINPEVATPVPWKNRQLHTERLSRAGAKLLLLVGIALNLVIFVVLAFQFVLTNTMHRDLSAARLETERASSQLMVNAYNALQSDVIKHFVRIQQLLDELRGINGTLVKYDVNDGHVTWEAYVPQAYGAGIGTIKGQVLPGIAPDGRVKIRGGG
ncbi:MAG: hypothetical protein GC188_13530 [Alphaproteobacteria bacterium]|nr:hypothetical protein [Alphaproteobacteria bacterium]